MIEKKIKRWRTDKEWRDIEILTQARDGGIATLRD